MSGGGRAVTAAAAAAVVVAAVAVCSPIEVDREAYASTAVGTWLFESLPAVGGRDLGCRWPTPDRIRAGSWPHRSGRTGRTAEPHSAAPPRDRDPTPRHRSRPPRHDRRRAGSNFKALGSFTGRGGGLIVSSGRAASAKPLKVPYLRAVRRCNDLRHSCRSSNPQQGPESAAGGHPMGRICWRSAFLTVCQRVQDPGAALAGSEHDHCCGHRRDLRTEVAQYGSDRLDWCRSRVRAVVLRRHRTAVESKGGVADGLTTDRAIIRLAQLRRRPASAQRRMWHRRVGCSMSRPPRGKAVWLWGGRSLPTTGRGSGYRDEVSRAIR